MNDLMWLMTILRKVVVAQNFFDQLFWINSFIYDGQLKENCVTTKCWRHGPHLQAVIYRDVFAQCAKRRPLSDSGHLSCSPLTNPFPRTVSIWWESLFVWSSEPTDCWMEANKKTNFAFPQSDCSNRSISVVPIYKKSLRIARGFMNKDSYYWYVGTIEYLETLEVLCTQRN